MSVTISVLSLDAFMAWAGTALRSTISSLISKRSQRKLPSRAADLFVLCKSEV
jgi:hypothetical protein